jgi:GDP-L-fucose synthase
LTNYGTDVGLAEFHSETKTFFFGRHVAVSGGSGFIGSHVVEQLLLLGAFPIIPTRKKAPPFLEHLGAAVEIRVCNLEDLDSARDAFRGASVILSLAGHVGGVGYNKSRPASLFTANLIPFTNTLKVAAEIGIDRFLVTSSACVYAGNCIVPTPESEGIVGIPEQTNIGYGWAKRMEEYLGAAYAEEFGLEVAIARPYNAYGPRDEFRTDRCHVIPALINKAVGAANGHFKVWGDGSATRSFLYVDDFARGLLEITARHARAEALNLGGDDIHSIGDLAQIIGEIVSKTRGEAIEPVFGYDGPTGQILRGCDTSRLRAALDYRPNVALRDGLQRTINWFLEHEDHPLRTHP